MANLLTPANLRKTLQITILGALSNILLAITKTIVGFVFNSHALIADGLHSLLDLISDGAAYLGLQLGIKPTDEDHHFGHYKFSNLATLLIASVTLIFSCSLIWHSLGGIWVHKPFVASWSTVAIAGLSVMIKEWVYFKTRSIAKEIKSGILSANAIHHRQDSISSALVLFALIGSHFKLPFSHYFDAAAAIFIGIFLIIQSGEFIYQALHGLLDTAPTMSIINDIREHILTVPGAIAYHDFRMRPLGDFWEVDLHLQVASNLSIEEAHTIAGKVKHAVIQQHPDVLNVLVHLEPASPQFLKSSGISDTNPKIKN